ncbi:MAG: ABC transporter permease [Chloroflexota bacterium]
MRALPREILRSGVGRLGVILAIVLSVLAIWVVLTYPPDFGPKRWSDPSVWADYPKAAPPAWTNLFGANRVQHRILTATEPSEVKQRGKAEVRTYAMPFTFSESEAPTFLSFQLGEVTFNARPPSYSVVLVRPDGAEVTLYRDTVSGARPGESGPPYVRNADKPARVLLSAESSAAEATAKMLQEQYGLTVDPSDLQGRIEEALFGEPDGNGGYTPLHGDYRIEVRMAVADPADTIAQVGAVAGGAVYGLAGTDTQGRDLMQGLLFGLPVALLIGLLASVVSTTLGTSLGLISGFMGGRVDLFIQRSADVVNNVPTLPLLIFMVYVFGSQLWLIMLVLVLFSWPGLTITVRSMVLGLRGGSEVEAARALGASRRYIIRRHVFPHTAPFVFTSMVFFVPATILAEAGLSFLGLGDPSLPTWGQILEEGFRTGAVFLGYWWWVIGPGLMIVITAVTFMLLSVAMEPIVNPRLRRES